MFLIHTPAPTSNPSFPRIRGDVPCRARPRCCFVRFSPHTRGCSAARGPVGVSAVVFPAYAGMFRFFNNNCQSPICFPRIRGDVPTCLWPRIFIPVFSPHTRGCSVEDLPVKIVATGFPRIRGDVPEYIMAYVRDLWFSPHTRGCSYFIRDDTIVHGVFPAYAGMFRTSAPVKSKSTSFPRIRGDVPSVTWKISSPSWFSPHTRGCSARRGGVGAGRPVFPAYAGMFPAWSRLLNTTPSFPRIRGDIPEVRPAMRKILLK